MAGSRGGSARCPDADDESRLGSGKELDRHGPLPLRLATQAAAFARLLPKTDVFHFYFGLTLVPKSLQFPILRAARKRSVSMLGAFCV